MASSLRDEHVADLLAAVGERWCADEVRIREAITRRSSFNLIRLERMVKVDVFVPPDGGFHASKIERARFAPLNAGSDRTVTVTSPEDIVLQKLKWFRSSPSPRVSPRTTSTARICAHASRRPAWRSSSRATTHISERWIFFRAR
jgi:hypothetical protein